MTTNNLVVLFCQNSDFMQKMRDEFVLSCPAVLISDPQNQNTYAGTHAEYFYDSISLCVTVCGDTPRRAVYKKLKFVLLHTVSYYDDLGWSHPIPN